jgi:glutamate dehydrogenase/leucine dehydrogenase
MLITKEILHRMGIPVYDTTVAIQGAGNVGGTAARLLFNEGMKIIALSDISGGVYNKNGLAIPAIMDFVDGGGLLKDYENSGFEYITNEELLTCEADVLIPAAMENQIDAAIAEKLKAKVIVEGANGPTTVEADSILNSKGTMVVPDILANAGGVVVSYFEWVQNIQSLTWDFDEVNRTLEKIMIRAFNEVWEKMNTHGTTMRTGAYIAALERLADAKRIRGIFP